MIYLAVIGLALLGLWLTEKRERKQHDASRFRRRAHEHEIRAIMDTHPIMRGQWNPPKTDGTLRLQKR